MEGTAGQRVCVLALWAQSWEGEEEEAVSSPLLLLLPGGGTGQPSRAHFPRNLQPWSQHKAVVLGRPRASVTPIKLAPV